MRAGTSLGASKNAKGAAITRRLRKGGPGSRLLGLGGEVTEPKRRSRTPLTAKQIDDIHTARDNGESFMSIPQRFEANRTTGWKKTARTVGPSTADLS
ncbi:hypothetical protein KACC15558_33120 [Brevibacterium ammoniilyticum]|uniref:Uncharacterized protein n=1 Tax=Brevibacterium ammoniilyticum TaxID=1046555 RepID=A0ABP9U9C1_9MICO